MGEPKKKETDDSTNHRIQEKFDLIFERPEMETGEETESKNEIPKNENSTIFNPEIDELEFGGYELDHNNSSTDSVSAKSLENSDSPKLDLTTDDTGTGTQIEFEIENIGKKKVEETKNEIHPEVTSNSNNLEFSLDSEMKEESGLPAWEDPAWGDQAQDVLDATQKTVLYDPKQISGTDFSVENKSHSSADLMSREEATANIENTIKTILGDNTAESTQVLNLKAINNESNSSKETSISNEFDFKKITPSIKELPKEVHEEVLENKSLHFYQEMDYKGTKASTSSEVNVEDSVRIHATIRQLREEREDLLGQIKNLKVDYRELEQDNLTIKAALDESKIEISILRKRHMTELEDINYRLSLNEEKKQQALEKARLAEGKREKLEQRVRIDFNQVKQREKELETKLEMLTIDVDAQVQSRDQKILELRRKIDALEFNMENVSIKEQKSQDDKRRLEDKLNKIMKTLRRSIKNVEDDIDQEINEDHDERKNGDHRSGKT